jgi:hypothetical protein
MYRLKRTKSMADYPPVKQARRCHRKFAKRKIDRKNKKPHYALCNARHGCNSNSGLDYNWVFAKLASPWLTWPSTVTSLRKSLSSTSPRPRCVLISLMSPVSTEPSAFTSPTRNVMVPDASTELEAPFTPATLTVMSEPSRLTCPSRTVTVLPLQRRAEHPATGRR